MKFYFYVVHPSHSTKSQPTMIKINDTNKLSSYTVAGHPQFNHYSTPGPNPLSLWKTRINTLVQKVLQTIYAMQAKFAVTPAPQTQTYSDPTIIQLSAAQLANP